MVSQLCKVYSRKPMYASACSAYCYCTYLTFFPVCSTGTSCSSGKVAGLIFFEVFSFLWTSQVVGNVALATLAGGPYGGTYYWGVPRWASYNSYAQHGTITVRVLKARCLLTRPYPPLCALPHSHLDQSLLALSLSPFLRLSVSFSMQPASTPTLMAIVSCTRTLCVLSSNQTSAVEACLACCAECFVGCIERLVEYFNRYILLALQL